MAQYLPQISLLTPCTFVNSFNFVNSRGPNSHNPAARPPVILSILSILGGSTCRNMLPFNPVILSILLILGGTTSQNHAPSPPCNFVNFGWNHPPTLLPHPLQFCQFWVAQHPRTPRIDKITGVEEAGFVELSRTELTNLQRGLVNYVNLVNSVWPHSPNPAPSPLVILSILSILGSNLNFDQNGQNWQNYN